MGTAWACGMTGCAGYGVLLVREERKESGWSRASSFSRFTSSEGPTACSSAARRGERRDLARNVIMTMIQLSRRECGEKTNEGATGWGEWRRLAWGRAVAGATEACGYAGLYKPAGLMRRGSCTWRATDQRGRRANRVVGSVNECVEGRGLRRTRRRFPAR